MDRLYRAVIDIRMTDAYLYGMISPSTVHILREDFPFPGPNEYAEVARILPSIGGEAANSAIVLSKLGLSTRFDGNWINPRSSDRVLSTMGSYGIDVSRLTVKADAGTDEIVIADRTSRTVFGSYAAFHTGPRQWNEPRREDIQEASIVCLDPYFRAESELAARLCVEAGRPYVTEDAHHESYIARNAAAIQVSHELRDREYAGRDMRDVFESFLRTCTGLVIFTFGADELWYARPGEKRKTFTPYTIQAVDTTGAGDSFRGAVAYGLFRGWDDERTVRFASAVAACVCLTMPHALNAPSLDGVLAFMEKHRSER
jgi:sugar/nucleoside kinase (ribokinase family)